MPEAVEILINEIRYAERLCQRTARLYRRVGTAAAFMTVIGASGTFTALSEYFPAWITVASAAVFAIFGALILAIRPAEKAAANEADGKRYAQLRTAARTMDAAALAAALDKARESDVAEIEPLRDVAFNDLVREVGHPELAVALSPQQRLLAAMA